MDGQRLRLGLLYSVPLSLFLAMVCAPLPAFGVDAEPELDVLLERIERLESDNRSLKKTVTRIEALAPSANSAEFSVPHHSQTLSTEFSRRPPPMYFQNPAMPADLFSGRIDPKTDESASGYHGEFVQAAAEEFKNPNEPDTAANSLQDQRISDLSQAVSSLQEKASKKTYPTVTVNGVFQADAGWIHQDSASELRHGQIQDGSDFRRARLSAKGSVTEQTNYFFQMDFGFFGRPTFTDVWLEQTQVPVFGNIRIGQWKQPFSLETVSSFRYTTFMERSILFQPFTPFRHLGIGFYDYSDDLSTTWAASVFRTGQDQFGATLSSDGGYGTAERLTYVPSWECDGKRYMHLGVGHFFNAPPSDTINFRTIPEFFVGANGPGAVGTSGQAVPGGSNGTPFFAATGNLSVPYYNVLGTEFLWVDGPLSLQSEAMVSFVNQTAAPSAAFPGAYLQAGCFLTGERRPFDRKTGTIDRVMPRSNFAFDGKSCSRGIGAWELAGRFSWLDLNDETVQGGTLTDYTAGLNWYWNPYTKMVFNYVHAISAGTASPDAHTGLFGVRAQLDF